MADQPGQHAAAHLRLHAGSIRWPSRVEDRLACGCRGEEAIGDQAVEVGVPVQRGAEVMDEGHRPEAGTGRRLWAGLANSRLDRPQKDAEHRTQGLRPVAKVPAHPLGQGEHPLANGHARQNLIGQGRRRLHHPARVAARAQAPRAAGEGYEKVVTAASAANAGKAVGQDAALQVLAEAALDEGGNRIELGVVPPSQVEEGLQVLPHQAVQKALLRAPRAVEPRLRSAGPACRVGGQEFPGGEWRRRADQSKAGVSRVVPTSSLDSNLAPPQRPAGRRLASGRRSSSLHKPQC